MSLDVYLEGLNPQATSGPRIFIREDGATKEISRAEWDERYPGRDPVVFEVNDDNIYSGNITHNLNTMADAAGIYKYLWRPEEVGITKAWELIEPLRGGLEQLQADPEMFKKLNPKNGWGSYEGLVRFITEYLAACETNPDATVKVWR